MLCRLLVRCTLRSQCVIWSSTEPNSNVHFKGTAWLDWTHPLLTFFGVVVCIEQDGKVRNPRAVLEKCSLCPAGENACLGVIFLRAFHICHHFLWIRSLFVRSAWAYFSVTTLPSITYVVWARNCSRNQWLFIKFFFIVLSSSSFPSLSFSLVMGNGMFWHRSVNHFLH